MSRFRREFPNILTYLRILIIPAIIYSFYLPSPMGAWVGAGLFAVGSVTDYFDGMLARSWNVTSKVGTFLDPIADKLLVATVLVMLAQFGRLGEIEILAAVIILAREIFVSGLREFLGQLNVSVPVSRLGKIKTAAQMLALFLLMLTGDKDYGWVHDYGVYALWAAAALTIITGYAYFKTGLKHLS